MIRRSTNSRTVSWIARCSSSRSRLMPPETARSSLTSMLTPGSLAAAGTARILLAGGRPAPVGPSSLRGEADGGARALRAVHRLVGAAVELLGIVSVGREDGDA